jgi:anti-sigma B factor antagonist
MGGVIVTSLSCARRDLAEFAVIEVAGDVDLGTAPQLRQAIADAVEAGRTRLVLDLSNVTFLDSVGLGVTVGGLRRTRTHDGFLWLVVAPANGAVRRLLQHSYLDRVFPIHDSVEDAQAAARR